MSRLEKDIMELLEYALEEMNDNDRRREDKREHRIDKEYYAGKAFAYADMSNRMKKILDGVDNVVYDLICAGLDSGLMYTGKGTDIVDVSLTGENEITLYSEDGKTIRLEVKKL